MESGRSVQQGAALIGAILVAAVIAGIAVALSSRDQFSILAVTRQRELAAVDFLVRGLEVQAARTLSADAVAGQHDSLDESWHAVRFAARRGNLAATGRLEDAQRRFNLNSLAFDPPQLQANAPPGVDGPAETPGVPGTPDSGGAQDSPAATRALAEIARGLDIGVPAGGASPAAEASPAGQPAAAGDAGAVELSRQQVAVARFALLLRALDLPPELLPALLDWLDPDSDTRFPSGAEDEFYSRLEQPYRAANGRFADPSELRLVRGFSEENYAKLSPFVTVLNAATPINVNTAPVEILMSLGPNIDRPSAELLIAARRVQPFSDVAALLRHPLLVGRPVMVTGLATSTRHFELQTRIDSDDLPYFRRSLLQRDEPLRIQILRRQNLYTDG